ncbi:MAG: Xaa-Pro aminopeptidase [Myxococcales bacterium]|nr:Xaa-Pro aminopeptidase [Myxococcales bacterium]MCB9524105.1 Xaa-Pro aminopeptidase [Myxococcales bacterium]
MYRDNRQALLERLGEHAAVFFAAPEQVRNNDVHHDYRQDSDFYYLTGFDEPDCVLVLNPTRDPGERVVLFLRERDPERVVWDGEMLGVDRACEALGVDQAFPITELAAKLPEVLVGAHAVYHDLGKRAADDAVITKAVLAARRSRKKGKDAPGDVRELLPLLHEARLIKTAPEIERMRAAAKLAAEGHVRAMARIRPGHFEYELQAEMEYHWARHGARRTAYPSIVGSGPNACVLHYRPNSRQMQAGDLVLVDAGCELDYFASDITRTWPVSGKFTPAQKAVYEVVLASQLAAIERCRPGYSFDSVHDRAVEVLVDGMIELGLLKGERKQLIEDESFKRYYMHRTGHWIGMDVHDVGAYYAQGTSRALEPGMALTVEPGIYIAPDDEEAPAHLRGIGIRIEDDVLITAGAPDVLTHGVPKTVDALEALIGSQAE